MSGREARLKAGWACVEITPAVGVPLGGTATRHGRFAERVRDPLHARALHLVSGSSEVTLVAADLVVIHDRLHEAVADEAGLSRDALLLSATHTHSGPGGYWKPTLAQRFMGPYDEAIFASLVDKLAGVARAARADVRPAELLAAGVPAVGASQNRRRLHGQVVPELRLLRFEVEGEEPIDLFSFGAHAVIGSEREPTTVTADWPGEVCARIAHHGVRPIFFQGAVGGLSPLFPEFPCSLDDHIVLMGDVIEHALGCAERELEPADLAGGISATRLSIPLDDDLGCHLFPRSRPGARCADALLFPLRRWLATQALDARPPGSRAPLHLVRLGDVALLGTPCDLGPGPAIALAERLRAAGVRHPLVGSHCDDYVGYVHLPEDYEHRAEKGFRAMSAYENAMSLSGRDIGARFVAALEG